MGVAKLTDDNEHEFSTYEGLGKKNPFLAFVLICGIGSLAGIPPFAGFIAKLLLISVAFEAKLYFSLTAMIIGVVISIYYYFGWAREVAFDSRPKFDGEENKPDPWSKTRQLGLLKITLLILTITSLVFGIWQGPFGDSF